MKKLVNKHSKCPNVGFRAINILNKPLWRHIDRRSNIDVFEPAFCILGKPKISQLSLTIMYKYVGDLYISMHYVILSKVVQPLEYIFDILLCFLLLQIFFIAQFALKISFITQFCNDITVSITGKNLVAAEYIWMVELLQYLNL